ncbi:MAG: F0F1 ATP synthase subunit A [Bacteroidales bacterium]|nr:F0F1 ATP synthase subunit A [Bacteroidales bacterium]
MILSGRQVKFRKISTIILGILLLFSSHVGMATAEKEHGEEEEFNPGKMIVDHVVDSHEWHILTWGHKHVSIPLPVILYDEGNFIVFLSSKFHHPPHDFKYELVEEGPNEGKIINIQTGELPLDLSITKNVAAMLISMILISILFISIGRSYTKRKGKAPKGLQSLLEPLIIFIRDDVAKASIGEHKYKKYLPYLLTLFFFIFLNNLLGLVPIFPGGANLTGNIAVTGVMALFTFIITTFSGNKNYWMHIVNTPGVPWWLKIPIPLMPIVELMGVFTKPFVLMVRLFANITAGHIIVLGFMSLIFIFGNMNPGIGFGVSIVSVLFSVFMALLELLVAFIQAYVFTLLSALYFGMATEEHH